LAAVPVGRVCSVKPQTPLADPAARITSTTRTLGAAAGVPSNRHRTSLRRRPRRAALPARRQRSGAAVALPRLIARLWVERHRHRPVGSYLTGR
jgi:hypothetical protein